MNKKFGWIFLFILAAAWVLLLSPVEAQEEKQIEEEEGKPQGRTSLSVEVEQVRVDVTVQDKDGNLITGLQQSNFTVYEDKVLQEVTNFQPIEAPMTAVLVTEYSRVLPWELLYEAWVGSQIFMDQMRKEDWIAVVAYDMKPEILVDFTQNKWEGYNALRRLNFPAFSESNMYDTMWDVLDRVEELDSRVVVVLLSSGLDTFSKKNLDEILDRVKSTHAVIYPVSLGGNLRARAEHYMGATTRMDLYQADAVLKEFAKQTGGHAFFPRFVPQEYPDIFSTISALTRHQYSLSYIPTNTKDDGKFRKIRVEVDADINGDGKPDKLKVNHREGYQDQG
ncbi:MAG: VWA domain-containing protein [Acidobacteriota bacterium]